MKPKNFENFDNDTKRMLDEKSNVLKCVAEKVPLLRCTERCHTDVSDCQKNTLREFKKVEAAAPILSELSKFEKKLKAENISNSEKQILCNQIEELVES